MDEVTIYTDGACSGNPGPGGWGAILMYQGIQKEISGGKKDTTNNVMELTDVKNKELWQELLELTTTHKVTFHKVKGHSDNEFNNRCDELARNAIKSLS